MPIVNILRIFPTLRAIFDNFSIECLLISYICTSFENLFTDPLHLIEYFEDRWHLTQLVNEADEAHVRRDIGHIEKMRELGDTHRGSDVLSFYSKSYGSMSP